MTLLHFTFNENIGLYIYIYISNKQNAANAAKTMLKIKKINKYGANMNIEYRKSYQCKTKNFYNKHRLINLRIVDRVF